MVFSKFITYTLTHRTSANFSCAYLLERLSKFRHWRPNGFKSGRSEQNAGIHLMSAYVGRNQPVCLGETFYVYGKTKISSKYKTALT